MLSNLVTADQINTGGPRVVKEGISIVRALSGFKNKRNEDKR